MVGVVESFRWTVLGTPIDWRIVVPGVVSGVVALWAGLSYFRRVESSFADVA
jgi:lipopolysaccharide transport system permease protein